tara:strand:+ start:2307 stop:2615 length:309 start_codon:yes stop_codon:yes gene_type:complete
MSDKKSKLPDMQELGSMASKLFKDVKKSVTEIVNDYKKNRDEEKSADVEAETQTPKKPKPEEPKAKTKKTKPDSVNENIKKDVKVDTPPIEPDSSQDEKSKD